MVKKIDGLLLPPSIDETPYLTNRDTQRQTVSGRLITKLDTEEKWVVPVSFNTDTLSPAFKAQFYAKCLSMRTASAEIVFISPYDGSEITITAKCISRVTPKPINMRSGVPQIYTQIGATFQEV